jgi:hypothetical protein
MRYGYDVMPWIICANNSVLVEENRKQFPTYKEAKSYADELAKSGKFKAIEITRFIPFGRAHLQEWDIWKGWHKAEWERIKRLGY